MRLEQLTWREFESVPRERLVLFPLAAVEQHGPHLPFGVDSVIMRALIDRIEEEVGDKTITLPVQWIAHSERHRAYPGTVSVPWEVCVEAISSVVDSMASAGFGKLLLLNGQFGNDALMEVALRNLRQRRPGAAVIAASYWALLDEPITDEYPGHAGRLETSLMMHLAPNAVRADNLARDGVTRPSKFANNTLEYARMDQRSHQGAFGDPESASAEAGKLLFEEIAERLAALIHDLHDGLLAG